MLERQIAAFLSGRVACPSCGRARGIKDHKSLTFRTLFGKLVLASPRLRHCPCAPQEKASFSPLLDLLPERTAPELRYPETRWASLVAYGLTAKALGDFLPVDMALNAMSVRRDTLRDARRLEAELGPRADLPPRRLFW